MAKDFELITSNQLTGDAASVTFSISSGKYYAIELRVFGETTSGGYYVGDSVVKVNGSAPTNYYRAMRLYPAGAMGGYAGASSGGIPLGVGGDIASTGAAYMRIYGVSSNDNKAFDCGSYPEHRINGGDSFLLMVGGTFVSTGPITSLNIAPGAGYGNWLSGTRFDLYGIL